jgi:hypothetical protein
MTRWAPFVLVASVALLASPAKAFWIEKNPRYVNPNQPITHCSGRAHCKRIPGRVVFGLVPYCDDKGKCKTEARWTVRGMKGSFASEQVYWVPRLKQPWACMWSGNVITMTGGHLACLFLRDTGN